MMSSGSQLADEATRDSFTYVLISPEVPNEK